MLSSSTLYLNISENSGTHVTSRESHSNNIIRDVRQIQIKSSFLDRQVENNEKLRRIPIPTIQCFTSYSITVNKKRNEYTILSVHYYAKIIKFPFKYYIQNDKDGSTLPSYVTLSYSKFISIMFGMQETKK